jgi:hypothetical protein
MRNLLALGATALIVFAVVGWFLGWYNVSSTTDSDGHKNININVNSSKFVGDVKKGVDELEKKVQQQQAQPQTGGPPVIPVSNTRPGFSGPDAPPPVTGSSDPGKYVPLSVPPPLPSVPPPPTNYNQ